ncbi:REP element-mobilizing transposase RayT [Halpernia humi]|uniref:REP element-mobilizing transposase RayT n=1 Tax=Halpernia humi TaxID=493375 RepID=A0A1H6B3E3_9FLAO|nr:IS200/IS605 family transposase [Halpernia humi]SEG55379.1 REP element-mobilizing transposase RayT [Halpernia humi]
MSYTQIYYHIIFSTKYRKSVINIEHEEELYKYIWGIIKNKKCTLYRINGMPDHLHIFTSLHPTIRLSDLVKDIKVASNLWMKQSGLFPLFDEWQQGYGAFTYSINDKDVVINYIKNQKKHHLNEDFEKEYRRLLKENEIEFDEKYFL